MRTAILITLACCALAQEGALMTNPRAFEHYTRMVQLMESTTAAVPGLARAGEPAIENTRQALATLRAAASPQDGELHHSFLMNSRAYLVLAEAMPKPYPFPAEGKRQFVELREAIDRAESHFQALLRFKETQLRNPDRDQLRRYAESNSLLGPPVPGKTRIAFMGDSITDGWRLNEYFPDKDYLNRGISGQITSQMLARMLADVVKHKPAAMVVLAGTNDIARGVAATDIRNNLTMIADLADKYRIKVVLASILPVHDYNKDANPAWEMTLRRPMDAIRSLNQWLEEFCKSRSYTYLDYFSAMLDANGMLKRELAQDGLHPNAEGYRLMAPLVEAAIAKVAGPAAPAPKKRPVGK